jgi:hypothetical protein
LVETAQRKSQIIELKFKEQRNIEIEGKEYPVIGIACIATRIYRKKKKWMNWSGDALYDWHTGQFSIPPNGVLVGSAFERDLSAWADYDGEIPELESVPGFLHGIVHSTQKWDNSKDNDVPDLRSL